MPDDTSDMSTPESHVPLMGSGNEEADADVGRVMESTDSPSLSSSPSADTEPPAAPDTIDASNAPDLPPYEPLFEDADPVEPMTVDFVYDEPATSASHDDRPVPVSARIEEQTPKKPPRTGLLLLAALVAGILGALLTVGILGVTGAFDAPAETSATPTTVVTGEQATQTVEVPPAQIINEIGAAVNPTAVAAKAVPSIVTVTVQAGSDDANGAAVGVGSGSGVVMSSEGYIITNHHVIDGGDVFAVEFEDGRVYDASLIGSDELTDLAVLQISAAALTPVEFGSSEALSIGDPAVAIGNPLGQQGGSSVTVGIVSAFDRTVDFADDTFLHGMIQTDAAINSGSSGGALFDAEGNLIGITSAIGVSQAGPEGIGYAIPIELVDRITAEIIETSDVVHPFLGVTIGTYHEEAADGAIVPTGAIIDEISGDDSAAKAAGLEPGDVVIRIGDKEIAGQTDLILAVRLYRVGDEVQFVAMRDGEAMTFDVVMGQRPAEFRG